MWKDKFKDWYFNKDVESCDVSSAIRLKQENLPLLLYKYREVNEYSLENLKNNTCWLSFPHEFNDPFDCTYKLQGYRTPSDEQFEEVFQDIPIETQLLIKPKVLEFLKDEEERNAKSMFPHIANKFNVCSFSELYDSILMWSHYGGQHCGFCIGYCFSGHEISERIFPVYYHKAVFDATDAMHGMERVTNKNYICQLALHKAEEWSYEKEWRIVYWYEELPETQICKLPKPEVVFLGAKIGREHKKMIFDICDANNIRVEQMNMMTHEFKLRKNEI